MTFSLVNKILEVLFLDNKYDTNLNLDISDKIEHIQDVLAIKQVVSLLAAHMYIMYVGVGYQMALCHGTLHS